MNHSRNGSASAAAVSKVSSSNSNNEREEPRKATKVEQSTNRKVASKKEEKSERITSIDDCKKSILQEFMNKNTQTQNDNSSKILLMNSKNFTTSSAPTARAKQ
jgi:hypothetical protein